MLIINPLNRKGLEFDVSISGIEANQLEGFLRFKIDDVEYGFPVEIQKEKITVDLPPLNEKIGKVLTDGEVIDGKLELVGNNFFMKTWQGEFKIQAPVNIETKLVGDTEGGEIKVKAIVEKDEGVKEKREVVSEEPPEKADTGEIPPKEIKPKKEEPKENDMEKQVQDKVNEKLSKVSSFVEQFLASGRKVRSTSYRSEEIVKPEKKIVKESISRPTPKKKPVMKSKTIDSKQDIYDYMKSKGLKSERVQEALYERAEERAENGDFQGIYEQLKLMLSTKGNF